MTFTEAAVEVLRLVGKPLHYKKITEVAIERNMLAHVGKTPEVTMSSRLATMVKRDRGEAPIIKVKPGVFGLREFTEDQLADLSGDIDEIPEAQVQEEQETPEVVAAEVEPKPEAESRPVERRPLPGADVFPEEADDDEPILGAPEVEEEEEAEEEGEEREGAGDADSRSARKRKRRRRRGRGDNGDEPRAASEERPERAERTERAERNDRFERSERNERPERSERNERREHRADRDRGRDRDRGERDRGERDRGERERDRNDRNERDRDRNDRNRDDFDFRREPADGDLLGKDLADAAASVLANAGPRGSSPLRIAEQLVRRGRLQGDAQSLVPTVMAAVRADVARSSREGARARFRTEAGQVVLSDFLLPQDVVRAEQDVLRAAERQRERARRAFLRKMSELPVASLAEVTATWLNAEGVVGLRAVRRPGAANGELHFAGTLRRGVEELRIAVVLVRDGRELGRERVVEARGATHYYGNAQSVWLVTFGQVLSGAREEAAAPAAVPVALLDGMALAAAMERAGVGIRTQTVAISTIDIDLFDALRGRERGDRERDQDRSERSRDRDRDRNERDRDRNERDRDRNERERDRGGRDRDRDRERQERERERERERDRERDLDRQRDEEIEAQTVDESPGVDEDEGEEGAEAVVAEAGDSAENSAEQAASSEQGEGGSRRRRRRRRRGRGRGEGNAEAAPAGQVTSEVPATTEEWDAGDEADEPGEPEAAAETLDERHAGYGRNERTSEASHHEEWREAPERDRDLDDEDLEDEDADEESGEDYRRGDDFSDDEDEAEERDRFEDEDEDR